LNFILFFCPLFPICLTLLIFIFLCSFCYLPPFLSELSRSDPEKSPSKVSSSSSPAVDSCTERLLQKPYPNSSPLCHPEPPSGGAAPRSPSTLPRSHTTAARAAAGRDGQLVSLEAQHSEVERKTDVFLDHLRQKYPYHAAIIMGHQGRKGEQVRPKAVPSDDFPSINKDYTSDPNPLSL